MKDTNPPTHQSSPIGFLFDLDGVLIDSETEYTRIWNRINEKYPTGIENFAFVIKGQTLSEILNAHYPPEMHEGVVSMLNEEEQKMNYEWLPGAKELLEYLKENNFGRVLVTSSNEKKMEHLREELPELESMFTGIVTADKIKNSKPDPEGYLLGASILGVNPSRCVVFEDSRQGVKAGNASGAFVVALTTTLPSEILEPYTDLVKGTLEEVKGPAIVNILSNRCRQAHHWLKDCVLRHWKTISVRSI